MPKPTRPNAPRPAGKPSSKPPASPYRKTASAPLRETAGRDSGGERSGQSREQSRGQAGGAASKPPFEKRSAFAGAGTAGTGSRAKATQRAAQPAKPMKSASTPRPTVKIGFDPGLELGARTSRRASDRLRNGHLWVYATDLETLNFHPDNPPALLPVADNRGLLLGTALFSPASQIPLRLVSREAIEMPQWLLLLKDRLRTAIRLRLPRLDEGTNACRLAFSEADNLPGVMVDMYAGIVVLQLLAKGLDNDETRAACVAVLHEELGAKPRSEELTVWERPDARIRELEGLSAPSTTALFTNGADGPAASAEFRLNGLTFRFDVNSGQKTGAFLDQSENYAAAAGWARRIGAKKALDVCTYQGGFALHLAQVCQRVTGVDASRASLEVAEANLETNRSLVKAEVDWVEADAFELLRAWSDSRDPATAEWDLIVLDPPAFAKSLRAVEGALRGYKELNLRALRMIRPGGILITCSCSHHVSWADLESSVAAAAVDTQKRVTLLERRGAALDHPVLMNLPETEYLKCLVCRVD